VLLAAIVKPGSKQPRIAFENGTLVLRVRERAVEGAANDACVRALAAALGVPASRVTLVHGSRSRQKRFSVEGLDEAEIRKRLPFGVL
jgi:uncharacterized protein YggU (UPF0235/DUF167 family)